MQRVYDFLKKSGVYYLATLDGGRPVQRPFGTVDMFEGKLYIQTGKRKAVARQMKADPHISISAMCGGKWIRISAEAVLDERIEPQESMLAAYPDLRAMYAPGDGNTEMYYLKNAVAEINSFGAEPEIIRF